MHYQRNRPLVMLLEAMLSITFRLAGLLLPVVTTQL